MEEIANQFFKAIPGDQLPTAEQKTERFSVAEPPTVLPDPFLDKKTSPFQSQPYANGDLSHFVQTTEDAYKRDYFDLPTSFDDTSYYEKLIPSSAQNEQGSVQALQPQVFADSGVLNLAEGLSQSPNFYTFDGSYIDKINVGYSRDEALSLAKEPHSRFDVEAVRRDFPILNEHVNGRKLVWFDNAATTQKPRTVIDRISYFYQHENSNIHRAAHELAARSTDAYEDARKTIKEFINAGSVNEIIFTRGTTESINLVASTWGDQFLGKEDEIIISNLEHHANIVPWQLLSKKKGFKINVIPVNDNGELLFEEYAKLLNSRTKLVTFTHVSNALGTVTPAKQIIDLAHSVGAKVLLDGAQSVSHFKVDLQDLNPDFFVLSGHKLFGPTGIGVLYGKEDLLNTLQPYQGGGNMIKDVTFEKTLFHSAPNRFEAGTGNIADAVGLGAAIKYVQKIGIENIGRYEHELLDYATQLLKQIGGVKLIGTAKNKASVLSFTLNGYSNEEVGKVLNEYGIAVRTGHHCAQPILRRLGYESSVRPSFAFYNTHQEIDLLAKVIYRLARNRR